MGETEGSESGYPYGKHCWDDIEPIFLSDVENAVVPIACSDDFQKAFAYFRALLQKDERSERALKLTTVCADFNPANYTVWQYRRNILKTLQKDLFDELTYCGQVIQENPKNYQVWHHRRLIVEWLNDPSQELQFTATILRDDSKNYHSWQHRQWVVEHFELWKDEKELEYSLELLKDDIRNNSAWNYRYFLISNTQGFTGNILDREIQGTLQLIERAPNNESSWNYLAGILVDSGISSSTMVEEFCKKLYEEQKCRSPYLLSFMVDILKEMIENKRDIVQNVNRSFKLLDELIEIDPIRRNYWAYQKRTIDNVAQKLNTQQ